VRELTSENKRISICDSIELVPEKFGRLARLMIEFAVYVRVDRTRSRFASSRERERTALARTWRESDEVESTMGVRLVLVLRRYGLLYLYYRAGLSHACPTDLKF
jgi:hypothetical protein